MVKNLKRIQKKVTFCDHSDYFLVEISVLKNRNFQLRAPTDGKVEFEKCAKRHRNLEKISRFSGNRNFREEKIDTFPRRIWRIFGMVMVGEDSGGQEWVENLGRSGFAWGGTRRRDGETERENLNVIKASFGGLRGR